MVFTVRKNNVKRKLNESAFFLSFLLFFSFVVVFFSFCFCFVVFILPKLHLKYMYVDMLFMINSVTIKRTEVPAMSVILVFLSTRISKYIRYISQYEREVAA